MGYAIKIKNVDFSGVSLDRVQYIVPVPCTGISLSPSSLTFDTAEQSQQITATLTPADTTDTLVWSSSNDNVASVIDGLVTIHGIGTAIITATCGNQSASIAITQTSLKAQYALKIFSGRYPSSLDSGVDDKKIINLSSLSGSQTVGQSYHAGNLGLHMNGGDTRDIECVLVPYGATIVKAQTNDGTNARISYILVANSASLVSYSGAQYAEYLRQQTFFDTNTGYSVSGGEAIVLRGANAEQVSTLQYLYFE